MAGRGLEVSILLLSLAVFATAQDDIRQPPEIKVPTAFNEILCRSGEKVELTCKATGQPEPHYEWYFNKNVQPLASDGNIQIDPTTGNLTIKKVDERSHEGFYQCYAKNTFSNGQQAVAISYNYLVNVARVEDFMKANDRSMDIIEGDYAKVDCDVIKPVSKGHTEFKWYQIKGQKQDAVDEDNGRLFIDYEGALHFTFVKRMDKLPDTHYACGFSNPTANIIRVGRRVNLNVQTVPNIQETKPVMQYRTPNQLLTFIRSKTAQLECVFSGYVNGNINVPDIKWYNAEGSEITIGGRYKIEKFGRVLLIENLVEEDEKQYKCVGKNLLSQAEATMTVNVTSEPIWVKPLMPLVVTQGQDARMDCSARSASGENPPEKPRWLRNGQRLDLTYDPNKYTFSDENRVLVVKSAQKNVDIACYQCLVSNGVGNDVFSDACLNVILPITFITKPNEKQVIEEGDQVNLTVVAVGDPLYIINYRWIIKNQTYLGETVPQFMHYDPLTKLAFINTTGKSDEEMREISGVYARELYNDKQKEVVFVEVELKDAPTPVIVPVAEAGFDYWIIGLIIGILIIIIVLLIICCVICKRKMLEGAYLVDEKEQRAGLDPEKELMDSGFHDLSRADYDDLPEKKLAPNMVDFDGFPDDDNESFGSAEYDGETTAFNEDGSFIGVYAKDKKPPPYKPPSSESNV